MNFWATYPQKTPHCIALFWCIDIQNSNLVTYSDATTNQYNIRRKKSSKINLFSTIRRCLNLNFDVENSSHLTTRWRYCKMQPKDSWVCLILSSNADRSQNSCHFQIKPTWFKLQIEYSQFIFLPLFAILLLLVVSFERNAIFWNWKQTQNDDKQCLIVLKLYRLKWLLGVSGNREVNFSITSTGRPIYFPAKKKEKVIAP